MSGTGNAAADGPLKRGAIGTDHQVDLVRGAEGDVVVRLSGVWHLQHGMPTAGAVKAALATGIRPQRVSVDTSAIKTWDSSLITFVLALDDLCHAQKIAFDRTSLPAGLTRLIELAETVPENTDANVETARPSFVASFGAAALPARREGRIAPL